MAKPAWLLIKHRDEWTSTEDVTELAPRSIVSDRLLVEIARDEGGNIEKAAAGDPPALLREALQESRAADAHQEGTPESGLALQQGNLMTRAAPTGLPERWA